MTSKHIQRGCITKIRIYYANTKQSEKKSGILEEIVTRGFVKLMRTLPRAKAEELRSMLVEQFGLYNYYRYRRGEFLMTPEIQERITRIASELGIGTPLVFDSIEERTHWGEQKVKAVL